MPLFTLTVRHECSWFSTQLAAPNAQAGVVQFLDRVYPSIRESAFGTLAPEISAADLVLFVPMQGLTNVWAATAGSAGSYVELVCSCTVDVA
ncbi:hypothetical protein [Xanthomonas sp. 4461]|uniref:hypothetical protein n=1 Tax=Xanthomonas sp. 4461 TaxID=3035313 RepID=UPI002166C83D|nr:hypothetical protein [Xanthomonas sp. 4461]MCS3807972.1 hypothetical protein [Xanthomonas sp. 4461]